MSRFAEDFPLNKDEHFELHQNMERTRDPETREGAHREISPQNQSQPQPTKQPQP